MLEKYIVSAKQLSNNNDIQQKVNDILFPLLCEDLGYGYDATSIAPQCIFGISKNTVLDYGIIDNIDLNTYKLGIKLVYDEETFSTARTALDDCMKVNPGVKYGLVTDCITFEFYENVLDKNESTGIQLAHKFDIRDPRQQDEEFIRLLEKQGVQKRQDYIEEDSPDFQDRKSIYFTHEEYEDPEEDPIIIEDKPQKKIKKKEEKPKSKVPFILAAIALGIIVLFFALTHIPQKPTEKNPNPTNTGDPAYVDWDNLGNIGDTNKTGTSTDLQYLEVKAVLATKNLAGDKLELSLLNTNILDGTKIKFAVICGSNKDYVYSVIKKGECSAEFQIPSSWNIPDVTVIAYMRFDEDGDYKQPKDVREKYGELGEYIIQKEGAPQYAITYTTTTHENDAVIAYINNNLQIQQQNQIAKRDKDFAQIETLYDAKGNIKHVPKGFSLTEANITETRHVYPMIFHDAAKGKSYFYIVAGYIGKDWILFESVVFYADTYSWGYVVGSNQKERQLGGAACSEWVYYTDESVLTILDDMNLLSNSNETKIRFSGPIKKDYTITQEEKDNIKLMLYIYETYYGNGTKVPDIEWFKQKDEAIDLSYLKNPVDVRMRDSAEILDMESLQTQISNARTSGKTVSSSEQTRLEQMQKTYKPVSDELFKKLFSAIKTSEAYAIYDFDEEHGTNPYMKFYLYYDNPDGTIESGYIPYITIYSNKLAHIPLITTNKSTSETTKTLVEITLDPELYAELVSEMKKVSYQYFGNTSTITDEIQS